MAPKVAFARRLREREPIGYKHSTFHILHTKVVWIVGRSVSSGCPVLYVLIVWVALRFLAAGSFLGHLLLGQQREHSLSVDLLSTDASPSAEVIRTGTDPLSVAMFETTSERSSLHRAESGVVFYSALGFPPARERR